jgi:hypothetical protein
LVGGFCDIAVGRGEIPSLGMSGLKQGSVDPRHDHRLEPSRLGSGEAFENLSGFLRAEHNRFNTGHSTTHSDEQALLRTCRT